MEVHKHPHHVTHTKNWGEYFLEFFMLFLAVFLGFIAENIREHFADEGRTKEYMSEIVQNLTYDIKRCAVNGEGNVGILRGMDSLRVEIKNAIHGNINSNALYYFSRYCNNINQAAFNTSAITELKNSGSLRLISNKNLINELSDYYERKLFATNTYLPSANGVKNLQYNIFSLVDLDDYIASYDNMQQSTYDADYNYQSILNRQPALTLLTSDPVTLEKYYTQVSLLEIEIKRYNFWLQYTKSAAEKLIVDIKKEYDLKVE